jgi:hypothetical protein
MNKASKGLTAMLCLALVFTFSYLVMPANCTDPPAPTVKPDIPVPSVPQFTLNYADHSYIVPAENKSTTNPYTGEVTTTTIPSYHVQNYTIDVTIKNQQYPAVVNGTSSYMRYQIQSKGHFETDWTSHDAVAQKDSESTVVSIPAPYEGDVDVRVSASLGYDYQYHFGLFPYTGFAHESSAWSNIQTIIVKAATPSPTWGLNFTLPYLNWLEIGIFVALGLIIVVLVILLVLSRKRIKALEMKQNGP